MQTHSFWPPRAAPGRSTRPVPRAAPGRSTRPVPTAAPSVPTAAPSRLNGVEPWIIHRTNIEGLLRGTGLLQNHGLFVTSQNFWLLLDIPVGSVAFVVHICTFESQYSLDQAEAMFLHEFGIDSHLRLVHAEDGF